MTVPEWGLAVAVAAGLLAALAGLTLPVGARRLVVGVLSATTGVAGAVVGAGVLAGLRFRPLTLPGLLPLSGMHFEVDALSAVFVLAAGLVIAAAAVYGIGYCSHGLEGRIVQGVFPLFVVSLLLVPAAASVSTLLATWELMAVTSLVLVAAEHRQRHEVREAAWWYGVMSHLSLVAILIGLLVLAAATGGERFDVLRAGAGGLSEGLRSGVFMAALVGFGAKAGMVPLHVWLPRAHPEAPSQVSALMSGVMVKLGVYGLIRVGWDLLGGGPAWWGLVVLGLGLVSALFGILHALVAGDLKRLLAYSTTENVGLILVGVGAAGVYASVGDSRLAGLATTAALLHVVNHAVFKGLLFLGAGSVLSATGTRDLDRLGGLVKTMPVTAGCFAVGALAISALPPLNGFVSEWLLLKSLVHAIPEPPLVLATAMPLAVGAVALTGGLAAAAFVKAFGVGFLALPRSNEAEAASEVVMTMRVAMVFLAVVCVGLGLAPGVLIGSLRRSLAVLPALSGLGVTVAGMAVETSGPGGSLSPMVLGVVLVVVAGIAGLVLRRTRQGGHRRRVESWGCGRTVQTARMEYTATSFAEPLQRVFDDLLRPELDIDVSHGSESRYYLDAVRVRLGITDAFETHLYLPLVSWVRRAADRARVIQNGSIHLYLGYLMAVVVVVLLVSR